MRPRRQAHTQKGGAMKKLSLFILLVSLVCLVGILAACNTETPPVQDPCASGHTEVADAAVAATCTEAGLSEGSHCSVCNKVLTEQKRVEPIAHTAGEWVDQIPATCTQIGVRQQPCSVCNTVLATETVASTEHEFGQWSVVKAATCQAKGQDARVCGICGEQETREQNARKHISGAAIVDRAATCASDGLQHFSCITCGTLIKYETIPAPEHQYSAWVVTLKATCKESGKKESTCDFCGHSHSEEIPQLPHDTGDWIIDLEATCDTDGSRHKMCSICENTVLPEKINAKGHSFSTWKIDLEPSCTTEGAQSRSCSVCHTTQTQAVEKLAHTPDEWVTDVPATCSTTGSRHQSCTACGVVLNTQTIETTRHQYNAWTPLYNATCETVGIDESTCASCGHTETRTHERLPHSTPAQVAWIVDVSASCEGKGSQHKECAMCGKMIAQEEISSLGHRYENETIVTEPTCVSQGEKISGCVRCDQKTSTAIPTVDHKEESDWTVDIVPTCSNKGSQHKKCTQCKNVVKTQVLDTLSHSPADTWTVQTMPTANTNGTSAKLCTVCGTATESAGTRLEYGSAVVLAQTKTIALGGYAVIYKQPASTTDYFTARLNGLCTALKNATGSTFTHQTDATAKTAKEILIGRTNRPESEQVYATLKGRSFAVRTVGDKIVIVGTDDALTLSAVQYFINQYLGNAATITLSVDVTAPNLSATPLASSAGSNFVYVSDADLDRDPLHMYVSSSSDVIPGDGRDYPVYLFEKLLYQISTRTSLGLTAFPYLLDTNTTHANGYEVQFGEIDRTASRAFRDLLAANEYGFAIWDNKVIIAAHTDAALEAALNDFLAFYDYLLSAANGILPQCYTYIATYTAEGWIVDFPQPEGVRIENAQNNNDNSIQIIYTGLGADGNATLKNYTDYCSKLVANGYTLVANMQYDNVGDTGNYFRTYKKGTHVLYVAYNAYSKQAEYANVYNSESTKWGDFIHSSSPNGYTVNYPMRTWKQCIRVVSAPESTAYLPEANILTQQSYPKITNSSITNIRIEYSVGMSYVLQLEDGRFVIIDGGGDSLYSNAENDKHILYATLSELHKRATGSEPSASNPIHIAAWLITHSHADHYGTISKFLKHYAPEKTIKMDYLIGNFPELSTIYPVGGDTTTMGGTTTKNNKTIRYIDNLREYFSDAGLSTFKFVKAHAGMTLYFANLKMEVLMTTEDHAPFRITNSNDTNTVTKWTIASSDAESGSISADTVKADTTTTTWTVLGDSCIYASRWLCAMWGGNYNSSSKLFDGGYLSSYMVQLAHHGNIGSEIALYKTVQPTVVFFPHYSSSYNSYTQNGTTSWARTVDSYVINDLSTVKYIIVAGIVGTSYTDSITISFNKDGIYFPDRPSFFNWNPGDPAWGIKYDKTTKTVTNANVSIAYNTESYGTKVNKSPVIKK